MKSNEVKIIRRTRRKRRIRKSISGCAACPRLSVFRSLTHVYAQIIDDEQGVTLCAASTRDKDVRESVKYGGNRSAAAIVGKLLADKAKAKKIEAVRFDRNGYKFHGRVKALADAAREAGLKL